VNNDESQHEMLAEISEKLDAILGFMVVRDLKGDASLIVPKLKAMGMSVKTIALVSGISENAVAIRLTRLKKPGARQAVRPGKKKRAASAVAGSAGDSGSGNSNDSAS
jgi:hypothetical protein